MKSKSLSWLLVMICGILVLGSAWPAGGGRALAADNGGHLWQSGGGGSTWAAAGAASGEMRNWQAVGCDASGQRIVACVRDGRAYVSSDGGLAWSELQPAGDTNLPWKACAMSDDGSVLVLTTYPSFMSAVGRLYHSVDAGATWSELRPADDINCNWQAVGLDATGARVVAVVDGGSVWTSSDRGAVWTESQPGGGTATSWQCCAVNSDGSHVVVGAYAGRLYTGTQVDTVPVTVTLTHGTLQEPVPTEVEAGGTLTLTVIPDLHYYVYGITRGGVRIPLDPVGRNAGGTRTLEIKDIGASNAAITVDIFRRGDIAGNDGPDGVVDIIDVSVLVREFRQRGDGLLGDLNCDGRVDVVDVSMAMSLWGR